MKTSNDPRHLRRQKIVQELFGQQFIHQNAGTTTNKIMHVSPKIDKIIEEAAPDFPVEKINKIDLAILRLATFELMFDKKEPEHVVIDEAVELAKEFGNDTSPAFVNGVLGHILSYGKFA